MVMEAACVELAGAHAAGQRVEAGRDPRLSARRSRRISSAGGRSSKPLASPPRS